MNRNDRPQLEESRIYPSHRVPGVALDTLRGPLSVILAQAQVLERRVLQGRHPSPDDQLSALAAIQRSVWDLERQLRELQKEANPHS